MEGGRAQKDAEGVSVAYLAGVGEQLRRIELRMTEGKSTLVLDGREHAVDVREIDDGTYSLLIDGRSYVVDTRVSNEDCIVSIGNERLLIRVVDERWHYPSRRAGAVEARRQSEIRAMMPGKVVEVFVQAGEYVKAGRTLLVIEAMKMENEIKATGDGEVKTIRVEPGQTVKLGDLLVVVE
jgi:biotin carboxyl carrier protein